LNYNICISQNINQIKDSYLIVLDIQQQFYEHEKNKGAANEMVRNVNAIISLFPPEKVVYVKSAGKVLSLSFKGCSVDTMPVPPLDSNLKIVGNNVFVKITGDAFELAELSDFFKNNNTKRIILTGLLAEKCIYNTALGGNARGYEMYIVPEAIVGKSEKSKQKAIRKMSEKGIKVLSINEIYGMH